MYAPIRRSIAIPVLALLAAGCADRNVTAPVDQPSSAAPLVALQCTVSVASQEFTCTTGGDSPGGARRVVIGGQNHYIRLTSSGNTYNPETDVFSTRVSVQNLLLAPMGTADGTTSDGQGVRVFFASGPTNGATVANADGSDAFIGPDQPFFQYMAELTAGILGPGRTSAAKTWRFDMNGAGSTSFRVYVYAAIPEGADLTTHLSTIVAGAAHNCALSDSGQVYCWGSDFSGQRGNGNVVDAPRTPTRVPIPNGAAVTSIASSASYSCALTTAGQVYCWGNGPGFTGDQPTPARLVLPTGVTFTSVSAGVSHACGLAADGRAYCWGWDGAGQLGNGSMLVAQYDTPTAVVMPPDVRFVSISAGGQQTCAIGTDQLAYCWGYGDWGQLGVGVRIYQADAPVEVALPPGEYGYKSVSTSGYHSCAVALSGKPYCWGRDMDGELGNGPESDATLYGPSAVSVPAGLTFTSTAGEGYGTCAVADDGSAYCWGDDSYGVLGNGAVTGDQHTPVRVVAPGVFFTGISMSGTHTCATSTGAAYCWGSNYWGAVGDGSELDRDRPVVVAGTR